MKKTNAAPSNTHMVSAEEKRWGRDSAARAGTGIKQRKTAAKRIKEIVLLKVVIIHQAFPATKKKRLIVSKSQSDADVSYE